ncbi:hypothetical protein DY000_02007585 [Brassica cretica]|uniref:Uncharacterized protein n=1 Tax=Brassica cretica TaxID=69181 RepID=A0ABQ7BVH7_BRACR|nr:hypothetical protein DY000_02007585 [Brassica cretica]
MSKSGSNPWSINPSRIPEVALKPGGHSGTPRGTRRFSFRTWDQVWDSEIVGEPGGSPLDHGIMFGTWRSYENPKVHEIIIGPWRFLKS